jgi:hypothetical protein
VIGLESTTTWTGYGAWILVSVPGPGRLICPVMFYDPNRQATTLLGGNSQGEAFAWSWPAARASGSMRAWEAFPAGSEPSPNGAFAAYEAVRARMLIVGRRVDDSSKLGMWELAYRADGGIDEACQYGFDVDGDGLVGCDDPDCWSYCTPMCTPGTECDAELSRCGDGSCNAALETCRMCPEDCACDATCGDFFCDAGESAGSCPGDCAASSALPATAEHEHAQQNQARELTRARAPN